jgi:two-component system, NarL family, sensor kinase
MAHSSFIILLGILAMLLMATGIVLFIALYQHRTFKHYLEIKQINERQRQELIQASIRSEEDERKRIAGELHDDVGATLASIKLFLTKATEYGQQASLLQQSKALLDESIHKVRSISHKLQPVTLLRLGLVRSIEHTADLFNRSGKVQITVSSASEFQELTDNVKLGAYRIIQELLNNIVKHAEGKAVDFFFVQEENKLVIRILHDGHGLNNETYKTFIYSKGTLGLKNIENRLQSMHGSAHFEQLAEGQFGIRLSIPMINPQ